MPLAVLKRQVQAEYQRLPLSEVVGSLVETLDGLVGGAVAQLDSAGSRYRAGTLPAAVEVDGRLHHLGSNFPPRPDLRRGARAVNEAAVVVQPTTGASWLLVVTEDGFAKRVPVTDIPRQANRNAKGVRISSAPIAEASVVSDPSAPLLVISAEGQMLRTTVGQVPIRRRKVLSNGRLSKGTRLMRLASGDRVAAAQIAVGGAETRSEGR
jgi:DNA gyrase/topoisomerase IV subunit A